MMENQGFFNQFKNSRYSAENCKIFSPSQLPILLSNSKEFTSKAQCIVEQYNAYQEPNTLQYLNGKRTLSENIADLMGIELTTSVYKRWRNNFNGKRFSLIGMDFTPNQLFWLTFAQQWCGIYREGMQFL
jgi:predicted metalloendopeptidase